MATPTLRLPFAWLGKYNAIISVVVVMATGAFFRFYQLGTLPPGVDGKSAGIGLQAIDLIEHATLPSLAISNGYAPLWVWLQALPIKLLGNTELALYLWPALLGTAAVFTTWLWARSWFGARIGLLAAFLLAVSPWAVGISRSGIESALIPFLVTLTLWLATRAWQQRNAKTYIALAVALSLDLLSGPVGWLVFAVIIALGLTRLIRDKQLHKLGRGRARIVGATALAIGLGALTYMLTISLDTIKALPQASGFINNLGSLGHNLVKTLLMFNVYGDENARHNLPGEPMLNVFVGLMLIAGILVSISRLHQQRYRLLFSLLLLLLPAIITSVGVPNAGRAVAALPIILTFAAIGISYMLELWSTTFPINSAARASGQAAIIVLLGLTLFQGYTQYFRAWGGSSEVYTAYNEAAIQMTEKLKDTKFDGQRYIVSSPEQLTVVAYLTRRQNIYQPLEARDIAGLPVAQINRQFFIAAPMRDEAVKVLKAKFPGGVLRPSYSPFNQAEIYYTYEMNK